MQKESDDFVKDQIKFMKDNPNKIIKKYKPKTTKTLAQRLMTKPVADKGDEIPHFATDIKDDHHHQADLLYLPIDNKSKYALVVADVGSRLIDAEPLTARDSHAVVEAITKIYKRDILSKPNIITTDQGSEFKAKFKTYCDDNKIFLRYAKPHRHRQVAIVERANSRIAKQLFERMISEEMLTKKKSTQWVAVLKSTVEKLNKLTNKRLKKTKTTDETDDEEIKCSGDNCDLIPLKTKVRLQLDAPIDYLTGKREHGYRFRETDIRWTVEPHVITNYILKPGLPPMYIVDDDDSTAYTKKQLQLVNDNDPIPNESVILPSEKINNEDAYEVEKIIDKKKIKNRIHYLVKWLGFGPSHNTWEPRSILLQDVPELIKDYDRDN
jgi:hypothetical protein